MGRLLLTCLFLAATLAVSPGPAPAQDADAESARSVFGDDRYAAGEDLNFDDPTDGDLFAAGEELVLEAPVAGALHMAGRTVDLDAPIAGAAYVMAYRIDADADIGGPATLFASEIDLDADLGGNLRLFAAEAQIGGTVAGSAILGAGELEFDAVVSGDLMLTVDDVDWGSNARVDGQLIAYTEGGDALDIPERVAPADRVSFRDIERFEDDIPEMRDIRRRAVRSAVLGFVMSVLFVAALATVAVALAPERVAEWRAQALARPGRSLLAGFLTLSAIAGSGIVLAMTVIGIPLMPAAFLLAFLAGYAGYVMGSYILGVGLWLRLGNEMPEAVMQKAGLAALGAVVAGVIGLIPFLGWLVVLALALTGLGAIALVWREGGPETA